jgi:membrane protein required for colicin V production
MLDGWQGLSSLDAVLLALVLVSLLLGVWRGLVFELMSLAGWFLAWLAASVGGEPLGQWMALGAPDSLLRSASGYVVAFVGTLVGCALLARLGRALVAATPLSLLDRLLGAGFGALRGLVLLLVLVTAAEWTPLVRASWWREAASVVWLTDVQRHVQPWLTPEPAPPPSGVPGNTGAAAGGSPLSKIFGLNISKNGLLPCAASLA